MKMLKITLVALLISVVAPSLLAQCNIAVSFTDTTVSCGQPISISASGFSGGATLLGVDFNSGSIGSGLSSTQTLLYNNPCGPSLDGTPSAWFGNVPLPRTLTTTASFDLSCGAEICFDLDFGAADTCGCLHCEDPDLPDEGVSFSYSIDGGLTWVEIFYFEPNATNSGSYYQWNNYCFVLPPAAWTPATMFRWDQSAISSAVHDHWGIDNISVIPANCNYNFDWAHIPGFPDNAGQVVYSNDTTTYFVSYTNGTTVCTDSVVLNVVPIEIDIIRNPNPIDCGSCSDLTVEFLNAANGSIVDDFDPVIDLLMWEDVQGGFVSTICGSGATGNALYFDEATPDRYAETIEIDATSCGNIDFCLYMGNTASSMAGCENNESGDDIVLEYSIDNGVTFSPIATYAQSLWDGANYQQCFSETMPIAAQTLATIFRWRQVAFFPAAGSDVWSLDEVQISCISPAIAYSWTTGTVNDATSPTPSACPLADELYTVSVTNSVTGCSATDTSTLFVNTCVCSFIQFDGVLAVQPSGFLDAHGIFEYMNSPSTGTLEVEATNGTGTYSQTFNLPFTNNQIHPYSITGIPNDGSDITFVIYFSDSLNCTQTFDLVSPTDCFFMQYDAIPVVQPGGIVDVNGSFMYSSSPSTGTLELEVMNATGTYSQTFNPPFVDSVLNTFSITGIMNDGSTLTANVYFTDSLNCGGTISITPPSTLSIEVIEEQDGTCIVAPNPVHDESSLIFNNELQTEVEITILNERGQLVFERTTTEESISIRGNQFKQGMYFFTLKSIGKEVCSGKFAVTY